MHLFGLRGRLGIESLSFPRFLRPRSFSLPFPSLLSLLLSFQHERGPCDGGHMVCLFGCGGCPLTEGETSWCSLRVFHCSFFFPSLFPPCAFFSACFFCLTGACMLTQWDYILALYDQTAFESRLTWFWDPKTLAAWCGLLSLYLFPFLSLSLFFFSLTARDLEGNMPGPQWCLGFYVLKYIQKTLDLTSLQNKRKRSKKLEEDNM